MLLYLIQFVDIVLCMTFNYKKNRLFGEQTFEITFNLFRSILDNISLQSLLRRLDRSLSGHGIVEQVYYLLMTLLLLT